VFFQNTRPFDTHESAKKLCFERSVYPKYHNPNSWKEVHAIVKSLFVIKWLDYTWLQTVKFIGYCPYSQRLLYGLCTSFVERESSIFFTNNQTKITCKHFGEKDVYIATARVWLNLTFHLNKRKTFISMTEILGTPSLKKSPHPFPTPWRCPWVCIHCWD